MRITNRFAAFAIHLGISFLMFLVLAAIIKFMWYPGVLFETEGGWEGIKLIAGVDLVIGPLLTLMVYNVAKKELKRDLAVIGVLQVLCIVGGMGIVAYSRPIAVVYAGGGFYTATREQYEAANIDIDSIPLLQHSKPVWINIDLPEDAASKANLTKVWFLTGGGIQAAVELYQPFDAALALMPSEGVPLSAEIIGRYQIPEALQHKDNIRLYELNTRYGTYPVLADTESGEILQTVELKK